jgi:hypothetical protein
MTLAPYRPAAGAVKVVHQHIDQIAERVANKGWPTGPLERSCLPSSCDIEIVGFNGQI